MKKRDRYNEQLECIARIGFNHEDAKLARRDASTLGRLSRSYAAPKECEALFEKIDKVRVSATRAMINAIFDAGRSACVANANDVLDNLR